MKSRIGRNGHRNRLTLFRRLHVAAGLLAGLRWHDLRTARTFVNSKFTDRSAFARWSRFLVWSLRQMFSIIPDALQGVNFNRPVSPTPIWLANGNRWANY